MCKSSTTGIAPQPVRFPVVSHRLLVQVGVARNAKRRGVPEAPAIAAARAAYRRTGGDRYAARRAGWAAVDRLLGQGRGAS